MSIDLSVSGVVGEDLLNKGLLLLGCHGVDAEIRDWFRDDLSFDR